MVIHERLRYAREKAGLTQQEVCQQSGVGASSLSEFEGGKREPRLAQLQKLARLYRRSIAFFFEEGPLPVEVVLWRRKPASPTAEQIVAKFLRLCEQYHHVEVWCGEKVGRDLPWAKGDAATYSFGDAEDLACNVRIELGLGDRPGPNLLRVLEEVYGVKVFHMRLEASGCAACSASDTFGLAVLLNSTDVPSRRNFDLGHELFHLLTWRIFRKVSDQDSIVADEREEAIANAFAGHLLMPTEPIRRTVNPLIQEKRLSLSAVSDIARQFDVSLGAILRRLKDVYAFDEQRIHAALEQHGPRAPFWEAWERHEPPLRSKRFLVLAERALGLGAMSLGRFAEYVGITRQEAMRFADREVAQDARIEIGA
jgi:Zn-dependent peptidase ImmA (M78 family)/transcriptional regulator with XRE-family HTH domain